MLNLRQANLADLEALVLLRLEFLLEVGDIRDDSDTAAIAAAISAWRDQGIATALLRKIISFVKETEAKCIWLHTTKDGKHLYKKLDFISTTK